MEQASAFYGSCVLFTASDMGVFKILDEQGDADLACISKEIGGDLRGTRLLLDGCVAVGLITKNGDLYSNTPENLGLESIKDNAFILDLAVKYYFGKK